jgi:hypothetical protein
MSVVALSISKEFHSMDHNDPTNSSTRKEKEGPSGFEPTRPQNHSYEKSGNTTPKRAARN